jgi:molecular chaperone GrpE
MKDKKSKPREEDAKALREALDKLHEELEGVQKERDELLSQLQRVSADYANFQKRVPKQICDSVAYEKEHVIRSLLPALDNFEHTLQKAHSAERLDVIIRGVEIIYGQMLDILKAHGVEQIHAQDEKFDPTLHEAMMRKAEPDKEEDVVLEEFQKGYKLNDRIIRPSKVVVNKLQAEERPEQQIQEHEEEAREQAMDEAEGASERESDTE